MAWVRVGTATVGPTTSAAVVGTVQLPAAGGLSLMCRQVSLSPGFRFAYGIVGVRSNGTYELGTEKCYPGPNPTVFRLGEGLTAQSPDGLLVFQPRSFNLAWVRAGWPLVVEFWADTVPNPPELPFLAPGFQDPANRVLEFIRSGTAGRVKF